MTPVSMFSDGNMKWVWKLMESKSSSISLIYKNKIKKTHSSKYSTIERRSMSKLKRMETLPLPLIRSMKKFLIWNQMTVIRATRKLSSRFTHAFLAMANLRTLNLTAFSIKMHWKLFRIDTSSRRITPIIFWKQKWNNKVIFQLLSRIHSKRMSWKNK